MDGRTRTRGGAAVAAALAIVVVAACSDDEAPSDELLRIEGPAQVDPSFEGIDGRQP